MKFVDEDIKDFGDYVEITTLNKFGIKILNTKKIRKNKQTCIIKKRFKCNDK